MDDFFLGEIRYVGFNFAPRGWALCNGQLMSIAQNTALFSLLGTFYGGDGRTTFGLPDLRGRVSLSQGQGPGLSPYTLGQSGGTESVTLLSSELGSHSHSVAAGAPSGTTGDPTTGVFAKAKALRTPPLLYGPTATGQAAPDAITLAGGGQPHNNMAPGLVMNAIIALQGIYPSRP